MKKRILLSDGCSCSTPCIYPPDWQSGGKALLKKIWYISYRFYSPQQPNSKQVIIKGMNEYSTLEDRRAATKLIYDDELKVLRYGFTEEVIQEMKKLEE
jgi:hypothetical protein